jgi:hypothetical protein
MRHLMNKPWSPLVISVVGFVYPLLSTRWLTERNVMLLPVVGPDWIYSVVAVLVGGLLLEGRDLQVARYIARREELSAQSLRGAGFLLLALAVVSVFAYHFCEIRLREQGADWVFLFFPLLYFVVLVTTSLGFAWLERAARVR